MRMLGAGIDAQIAHLDAAERAARDHALDGLFHHALGETTLEDLLGGAFLDATDEAGVLVIDLVVALAAASAIRSYLFGIEPRDGVTLVAACALVVMAALLAAYLPARRAPRVDPIAALRAE